MCFLRRRERDRDSVELWDQSMPIFNESKRGQYTNIQGLSLCHTDKCVLALADLAVRFIT